MENVTSYPLAWPLGFSRTPAHERTWAQFKRVVQKSGQSWKSTEKLTVAEGVNRVMAAIKAYTRTGHPWRINPDYVVISTNLRTRRDGLPASGQAEPSDPGVAVYFSLDEKDRVLCCDKWNKVADNLAAIAATLEAMRGLERWGVTESERAFTGFAALPAPGQVQARTCWNVLEIAPTTDRAAIDGAFRKLARQRHPDLGGSHEEMAELSEARDQALKSIQSV